MSIHFAIICHNFIELRDVKTIDCQGGSARGVRGGGHLRITPSPPFFYLTPSIPLSARREGKDDSPHATGGEGISLPLGEGVPPLNRWDG